MTVPPRRRTRRSVPLWKRRLQQLDQQPIPWAWLTACVVLYAAVGLILSAFPVPIWLWGMVILAILLQAIALAGPKALARFRWLPAQFFIFLGIVGATGLVIALSIALNYAGTDNIDDITVSQVILEVVLYSLLALVLGVFCSGTLAATGDRLLREFQRGQTSLILMGSCFLGVGLGGGLGVLIF